MNVKKPDVRARASRTFNIEAVSIALTPSWRHVERSNVTTEVTAAFQYVFFEGSQWLIQTSCSNVEKYVTSYISRRGEGDELCWFFFQLKLYLF